MFLYFKYKNALNKFIAASKSSLSRYSEKGTHSLGHNPIPLAEDKLLWMLTLFALGNSSQGDVDKHANLVVRLAEAIQRSIQSTEGDALALLAGFSSEASKKVVHKFLRINSKQTHTYITLAKSFSDRIVDMYEIEDRGNSSARKNVI